MARVPTIVSPCPLRWATPPQPGLDFCGHCQRRVHNLDPMSDAERQAFLKGCTGDVCVSYTVKRAPRMSVALGVGLSALAGCSNANHVPPGLVTAGMAAIDQHVKWIDDNEAQLPHKDKADSRDVETSKWLPTPKE
jgi:hypothetical protein